MKKKCVIGIITNKWSFDELRRELKMDKKLTKDQKILINQALGLYVRNAIEFLNYDSALRLRKDVFDVRQWLMNSPTELKNETEIL